MLYLLHSLWYHSWKLNHSTTSPPSLSDIILMRSTTQPLHIPKSSLSPSFSLFLFLKAQPLNHFTLPPVVSLLHSLWCHSWKLNHSTTSSPNFSLSEHLVNAPMMIIEGEGDREMIERWLRGIYLTDKVLVVVWIICSNFVEGLIFYASDIRQSEREVY